MEGNGGDSAVGMAELLVGTALADLGKPAPLEQGDNFTRLEYGRFRHGQATRTV
jgi:hypothetical protein